MEKALLQFCFCQYINASTDNNFERKVFEDSYHEFQMQSQAYNAESTLRSFTQMVQHNPKANSLHYKVGFAVGLYIQELKNIIPGLTDEAGNPVYFTSHEFRIIESEVGNRQSHKVAIRYFTNAYLMLQYFGEYMVLAPADSNQDNTIDTFTLKMQDRLSVIRFADVSEKWNASA